MNVPFADIKTQYDTIRGEIDAAISSVLEHSAFIGGEFVNAFEREFANYCRVEYAVGVSNGTDALRLALLACGVGPGDEVITVPNTFIATAEAISMVGARVRFVDVEPGTATMAPEGFRTAINERTRAVVPVHLYGQPADMNPILGIAREHGLKVVADAAQAHGAYYDGQSVGALGDAVAFSFYPGKNLGAYGDAGAVVTDDHRIAERVAMLRDHGRKHKYEHQVEGFNCRLDGLQAAVLSVKLRHLERWTERRRWIASCYTDLLRGVKGITPVEQRPGTRAVYHLFVVRTDKRDALRSALETRGVETGIHYPIPLHLQPAYAHLRIPKGSYPVSESLCSRILSLPIYPEMSEEQIRFVASETATAVREA